MKINSPNLTFILYLAIIVCSVFFYVNHYESVDDAFLADFFYLFFLNIGVSILSAILIEKQYRQVLIVFTIGFILLLMLYSLCYLYMVGLAAGMKN